MFPKAIRARLRTIVMLGVGIIGPSCAAQEPSASGLHDLVVYDPGKHERGLPAPEFIPDLEGMKVDIPQTVHVHRYYYSGDKEIQGPIIQGGPTVVVANHPKTGKRMYIDVVLPAGAPRIAYNKYGITYIYPDQRVSITFPRMPWHQDEARVVNRGGQGVGRTVRDANERATEHVREGLSNSPLVQSTKDVATETGDFLGGVRVTIEQVGSKGLDTVKSVGDMIPGVTYLKSLRDSQPQREYENTVRAAARKKDRTETPFVETNR